MSPLREGHRPCGTARKTTDKLGGPCRQFDYTLQCECGEELRARLPCLSGSFLG